MQAIGDIKIKIFLEIFWIRMLSGSLRSGMTSSSMAWRSGRVCLLVESICYYLITSKKRQSGKEGRSPILLKKRTRAHSYLYKPGFPGTLEKTSQCPPEPGLFLKHSPPCCLHKWKHKVKEGLWSKQPWHDSLYRVQIVRLSTCLFFIQGGGCTTDSRAHIHAAHARTRTVRVLLYK